ncbi:ABC transporter ATP-binding protein [Candidatus Woesearchaeota archaeon]|jgi:putative ABC transport system ATP-binding protein|nr:ABC transporter ATP-binding protein [Candidatus Woesearchaeota archaeon]MBT4110245.1 ABC transporter ATP-binding protein [Candidatus Woesearchaeota archaeon]MBT4336231.1 ABC transporter ATP-binding protein [Candidatus Woesearchaeota archaeon]MBT4468790.1 ABC transporter ATP-binding protein [Candidatus Woesearchaeota archaeon]MBT6744891.1 ABC transporter ATP-binding protein [Candidatus Woesearchaeota archaeon]
MKKTKYPLIELKEVWKTYYIGKVSLDVLKGVDLVINKGEFVVIVGPSGSGKSTMMNQVGVLDVPTSGTINLNGVDISTLTESDLAQLRGKTIGFVFQQFNLIPTLTALENVTLPTIFQNVPELERLGKAKELLQMVDLGDRMNHKPNELSGGQQQRVAIARALVNDPEIILADEPTGNLDSKSGQQVMDFLANLHTKEGKTIILVTHDLELVRYAQKVVYLKDGEVVKIKKNHRG